jgi:hypothetical protein
MELARHPCMGRDDSYLQLRQWREMARGFVKTRSQRTRDFACGP